MKKIDYNQLYIGSRSSPEKKSEFFKLNYGLVLKVLSSISIRIRNKFEYEDLIQTGFMGLVKAYNTFDPSLSSWSTYAVACIKNEIWRYVRNEAKGSQFQKVSLNADRLFDDDEYMMSDRVGYEDPELERVEMIDYLEHLVKVIGTILTDREMEVFRLFLANPDHNQKQVAEIIGTSKAYVGYILGKIRKNRDYIEKVLEDQNEPSNVYRLQCKRYNTVPKLRRAENL